MYRIRRFNILKTATVVAVMYMIIVAIFVIPFLIFGLVTGLFLGAQSAQAREFFGGVVIFGLFAIFGYGLLGWVFTAIACYIYNVSAAWVGGIEVQVEPVEPPPPLPAWMAQPPQPGEPPNPG